MKMQEPNKVARLLLAIVVCSSVFADYWEYSRQYHGNPDIWKDVIRGTADAPQQYRIGVPWLADFIAQHAHMGLRHSFTLLDLVSAAVAAFVLYALFERSGVYRRASITARWMGAAAFLFLLHLYLGWVTWYQRPETLPSTLMLAATLALASSRAGRLGVASKPSRLVGMLLLAAIEGFIRADLMFTLHLGLLVACVTGFGEGLALGRRLQAVTSVAAMLIAGGVQFYLMHMVYPHATYGKTAVIEIQQNMTNPVGILAFLLFMVPWVWLAWIALKMRRCEGGPSLGVLFGSAVFLAMWFAVGRIEEVRIFLPYAITLIPLTTECAMDHFARGFDGETDPKRMVNSPIS